MIVPIASEIAPVLTGGSSVDDAVRPVVVVGAHCQSLFMRVDHVPREGETVIGEAYEETVDGGKATNQAIAAARLGAPVRFVSLIGDDERGRRILGYLDREGVDRRWVSIVDSPTDVGFVMLPPSRIPAIATSQDLSRRLDGSLVQGVAAALRGASVVVCQLEAPVSCALAAFELARAGGAVTVLNPAPAAPLPPELLALVDVLVPNEHEATAIVGRAGPPAELAARLSDALPMAQVIVTAGADGAYLARGGAQAVRHVPAPRVQAVDTTGAGDAFVGALAALLQAGAPVERAATVAVAAAALSVTRPGTMEGFARLDELQPAHDEGATGTQMPHVEEDEDAGHSRPE